MLLRRTLLRSIFRGKQMKYDLIATCAFGLEAVVKREIENLDLKIVSTEDGKITFEGSEEALVRSNLWLRSADRILLKMGEFQARTFEELFQGVKKLPWEEIIPEEGIFVVNGTSVKSKLHSVPACQSIVKKAVAERLTKHYGLTEMPETEGDYSIKITLLKDRATLTIDTSGAGLHKRGYREEAGEAPIKETMAAALIQLSFWNKRRILVDPCCGSGTIPIEAALLGRNIAPGLSRGFASEGWGIVGEKLWKEERRLAFEKIDNEAELRILASDIDSRVMEVAKKNAEEAGVLEDIIFSRTDIRNLKLEDGNEIIITNPPYGERIGEKEEIDRIYSSLRRLMKEDDSRSVFVITADKTAENKIGGRKADRRRKLYNGRIETCYYQFHGKKKARPSEDAKPKSDAETK